MNVGQKTPIIDRDDLITPDMGYSPDEVDRWRSREDAIFVPRKEVAQHWGSTPDEWLTSPVDPVPGDADVAFIRICNTECCDDWWTYAERTWGSVIFEGHQFPNLNDRTTPRCLAEEQPLYWVFVPVHIPNPFDEGAVYVPFRDGYGYTAFAEDNIPPRWRGLYGA